MEWNRKWQSASHIVKINISGVCGSGTSHCPLQISFSSGGVNSLCEKLGHSRDETLSWQDDGGLEGVGGGW